MVGGGGGGGGGWGGFLRRRGVRERSRRIVEMATAHDVQIWIFLFSLWTFPFALLLFSRALPFSPFDRMESHHLVFYHFVFSRKPAQYKENGRRQHMASDYQLSCFYCVVLLCCAHAAHTPNKSLEQRSEVSPASSRAWPHQTTYQNVTRLNLGGTCGTVNLG